MAEATTTTPNRSSGTMTGRIQSMMSFVALVIRILLWPLRSLLRIVFPPNDLDGLSPAVTAKAAQSFVSTLRKQYPSSCDCWDLWSTTGFAALKTEATESNSLLLVYLHSPLHRQANVVVENILTTQAFQEFLAQPNLMALGCSIHSGQGLQLAQMLSAASFPVVALLQPSSSSSLSLLLSVQGPLLQEMAVQQQQQHGGNSNPLVSYLTTALTRHQVQLAEQEAQRLARQEEARLRREQDEEYHATLRADQERQRLQRQQEEERIRLEQEAVQRQEEMERRRQSTLQRAREAVRPAPTDGSGTRIRFVLPSGKKLVRSFESDETIGTLKAYLTVHFHDNQEEDDDGRIERIGLSTNYPKKTYADDDVTLEEAGLSPQAVLMVQDLDA